jgi:hypothetical protein
MSFLSRESRKDSPVGRSLTARRSFTTVRARDSVIGANTNKADHITKTNEEGADILPCCERLKEN